MCVVCMCARVCARACVAGRGRSLHLVPDPGLDSDAGRAGGHPAAATVAGNVAGSRGDMTGDVTGGVLLLEEPAPRRDSEPGPDSDGLP
jgi:hypothetical protein